MLLHVLVHISRVGCLCRAEVAVILDAQVQVHVYSISGPTPYLLRAVRTLIHNTTVELLHVLRHVELCVRPVTLGARNLLGLQVGALLVNFDIEEELAADVALLILLLIVALNMSLERRCACIAPLSAYLADKVSALLMSGPNVVGKCGLAVEAPRTVATLMRPLIFRKVPATMEK